MTEEVKKKKISEISFEHEGAHIALVSKSQGGPANQRHTLLFKSKSTADITDEAAQEVLASSKEEVEKAKFNSQVKEALYAALSEKYKDGDNWLYIEDFSESEIVFTTDKGMYVVSYSLSEDDTYSVEDTAREVRLKISTSYEDTGKVTVSEYAEDMLEDGVFGLITKSLKNPETNERLFGVLTSIQKKEKIVKEEIQKAVDAAKAEAAAEMAAVQAELTKAKELLAEVEAAKKQSVLKARQEKVASVAADQAEALVKATESLDDEAFETIFKALEVKAQASQESDLMKQLSSQGDEAPEESSRTLELLKSKQ